MTILVDSDILIEVTRGKDPAVVEKWTALAESEDLVLCSPVSVAELWHGARPKEYEALTVLFSALLCIPIDAQLARQAGEYLRKYHKSHNVELGDALIAATAVLQNAMLWTRNRKHYPMKELNFY
ncbi:MAG TPA: type II toxin-antitoxin system VapC family toxin [Bryobacteraceae bacterium]|nr:type II toxin-antitoxin system VapC family toxin [Bryobacteraceae bacterium]